MWRKSIVHGRLASELIIESIDGSAKFKLPNLIECDQIPNIRDEIPTPDIVRHHKHLEDLAHVIPHLDPEAKIMMLVGRDLPIVHHVLEQRISSTYIVQCSLCPETPSWMGGNRRNVPRQNINPRGRYPSKYK